MRSESHAILIRFRQVLVRSMTAQMRIANIHLSIILRKRILSGVKRIQCVCDRYSINKSAKDNPNLSASSHFCNTAHEIPLNKSLES